MSKILDSNALRAMIPCIPSMVLLDKAVIESETRAIGQKCITMNDPTFLGHFPNHPIFPGVLQIEAIFQLAEVLLRRKLDPELKGDFYLRSIRKVKFRRPNNPGDRMIFELDVTAINGDSADFTAVVKNGSGVACNAQGTVAIRPKTPDTTLIQPFGEYDKGINCVMDAPAIQNLIPHRFPFMMVDYVCKLQGSHVTGIKNLTQGEQILRTYEDGYCVLMGAVQAEMTAQTGAIYMLSREENRGKLAYFMGIDDIQFHCPVFPGQQLRLEIDMPDTKSKFGKGQGCLYADNQLASATTMLFAIVDP
ncbi:MAG: hypothetical protein J5806_08825 [Lentisphaeria bacterium]|nr:hypothetical protein [Lentisphaeria bacterium]